MERININNLFPSNRPHEDKFGSLDINTLFNFNKNKNRDISLDNTVDQLIEYKKEQKRKAVVEYKKILNTCLFNIKKANKLDKTDIIFKIPLFIIGVKKYDPDECLKYIETKLREMYMDTLILNINSIFISWYNIENNKNN